MDLGRPVMKEGAQLPRFDILGLVQNKGGLP